MRLFDFLKSRKKQQTKLQYSACNNAERNTGVCDIPLIHPQKILDTIEAAHDERVKHFDSPIKVIGIGGGGTNAVERMYESALDHVEYSVLNTDSHVLQSKVKFFANPTNNSFVHSIIDRSTKHVIIVAGFGGATGTFGCKWLVGLCKHSGIPFTVVCTIPFEFEGKGKQERALEGVKDLKESGTSVTVLYADDLIRKHNDVSLLDSFSLLDEYVAKAVHKICDDLSISQSNKEDTTTAVANRPHCCEVTTHCYGMTRTFADIILGLNEEKRYTSPDQALSDLGAYMQRFQEHGDNIASLSVMILKCILHDNPEIFVGGILDVPKLRELVFNEDNFHTAYDKAYDLHCREKLMNLVSYLNEFRLYSTPEQLRRDLFENTDVLQFSACGPISGFYYFVMSGATAMNYPVQFFVRAIRRLWSEITTDGVLDAQKMRQIMFGNHDDSVLKIGLENTINRDFIEDSPCHPEVYVPKTMGTAPIYVKERTGRYIRSCGEGKGPNSIPDWLEFQIAKQILENDKSYKHVGYYYIPKYDNSLPVYGEYSGRIVFETQAEKLMFINDVELGKQPCR